VTESSVFSRKSYPTDLTDEEWAILEPLIPAAIAYPNLQEPVHARREIVDAIRYRVRTGCAWRLLPHDFPPWKTVYNTHRKWAKSGAMKLANDALRERVRELEGRAAEPSAAIVDSQSVKGSVQTCDAGFDAGKKVKGRKRHVLVDVLGLIIVLMITSASVQDRDGAASLLEQAALEYSSIRKVWADGAYNGEAIDRVQKKTNIEVQVVKRSDAAKGFVVLPRRWVVERTFGWLERFRLLNREYERTITSSQANVFHASCVLMCRRLAAAGTASSDWA
jgi:putative transposase